MPETKFFEIRDRATFIPVLCVSVSGRDGYLARRAGFQRRLIYFIWLDRQEAKYDPFSWGRVTTARTIRVAHQYIEDNWESLESSDVVDVEFILGETMDAKQSERFREMEKFDASS